MTHLSPLGVTMLAGYREYDLLRRRAMTVADATGAGDDASYRVVEQAAYFSEIKRDYAEGLKMLAADGPVIAPDGSVVEVVAGELVIRPPAFPVVSPPSEQPVVASPARRQRKRAA